MYTASIQASAKPRYGWDRPDLTALSFVGVAFWFGLGLVVYFSTGLPLVAREVVLAVGVPVGLGCLLLASFFIASSLVTKFRQRDRLLDVIEWSGVRDVLDVGCGPGLMLIGAAKRAPDARAVGVDVWMHGVESSNRPERAIENAKIEGVGDRVEVKDGDVRKIPFTDSSFDVVLSRAVLHNLKGSEERKTAIRELARALRPKGQLGLVIVDSWHLGEYLEFLRENGVKVERVEKPPRYAPPGLAFLTIVKGRKR